MRGSRAGLIGFAANGASVGAVKLGRSNTFMAEYREARAVEMREAPASLHHVEMIGHFHSGGRPKQVRGKFTKDEHVEMAAHIKQHYPLVAQHLEAHAEQHAGPETVEQAASEPASEDVNA